MSKSPPHHNVAEHVIEKCGGAIRVAELTKRTTSWVYKWKYEKPRGRGGHVPHDDAEKLLLAAKKGIVDLTPADFFDPAVLP